MSAMTAVDGVIVIFGCMSALIFVARPPRNLRQRFIASGLPRARAALPAPAALALPAEPQSTP
jgi:hypothetical protein